MPGIRVITRDEEIHDFPGDMDNTIQVTYGDGMAVVRSEHLNNIAFPIDTIKRVEEYDD